MRSKSACTYFSCYIYNIYIYIHIYIYICGARWCRGMFGALQPEGCRFESTSRGIFGALQPEGYGFESTSKPTRRDPGQVLHSQLLMRFGVKLRFSVRAVVGSASE